MRPLGAWTHAWWPVYTLSNRIGATAAIVARRRCLHAYSRCGSSCRCSLLLLSRLLDHEPFAFHVSLVHLPCATENKAQATQRHYHKATRDYLRAARATFFSERGSGLQRHRSSRGSTLWPKLSILSLNGCGAPHMPRVCIAFPSGCNPRCRKAIMLGRRRAGKIRGRPTDDPRVEHHMIPRKVATPIFYNFF